MPVEEKIRVLIVDDIDETRENVRRLLQFDREIEVVGAANSGKEAITLTQQIKPDVVVMDINMPDIDGITATEEILKKLPYVQVVILSVQGDPSYMRRAMLAGARDFLTKPPSIDELTAAIKRAGKMAIEEKERSGNIPSGVTASGSNTSLAGKPLGKIIVMFSPKGGTGVTTLATNLALSLNDNQTDVLLVDASLQFGDVMVFVNEQTKNSLVDLTPRAEELDPEIVRDVCFKHSSGIFILAAPPRPEMAENVDPDHFYKMIQYLKQMYNYIVIDTTSYMTEVVQNALELADFIILVTTQSIPAIKNANFFLSLSDKVSISREKILFVMNMYDKHNSISPEKIGETLRQKIHYVIPADEKMVNQSITRGVPLMVDNKLHPISKSIQSLADGIRERAAKMDDIGMDLHTKK
jgi:pilus assembly protein CpaE